MPYSAGMLKRLEIQNFAIIEQLEIEFRQGMSIITGETGAGKSILMGALLLILGDRADTSYLMNREKKCFVEGSFGVSKRSDIRQLLKEYDMDGEEELVIRREIATSGKSRAFINDSPVTLDQLRNIAAMLVDLHRQFDTLELGQSGFQREVIDALAGNNERLLEYQTLFQQYTSVKADLEELVHQKNQSVKEYDYNRFLFDELEEAGIRENEMEEIEAEVKLLGSSENIKSLLTRVGYELNGSEQPLVQQLKSLANQLQQYASYHATLDEIVKRLQSVQIELNDVSGELEDVNEKIHFDPKRYQQLNDRLSLGYKLMKKHGVSASSELVRIWEELRLKLESVLNIDEAILYKEKLVNELLEQCSKLAEQISAKRKQQVPSLEKNVNALLQQVGMPNARLKVEIKQSPLGNFGIDLVDFLFDANKSNRFEPIRKVASGGELSRLMLCIKSLVAKTVDLPTMIFDEIDTGISGEAARQVGIIMKQMAEKRQLIAITHQPQIAGKADSHYYVFKEAKKDSIKTNIRLLTIDERITAVARMLSGEKPTAAAMENAREMVMN